MKREPCPGCGRRYSRRPVNRWTRASTRIGRLRQWIAYRVLGREGETCHRCGRGYEAWWCGDDRAWARAYARATGRVPVLVPSEGYRGLLCPGCFLSAAGESRRRDATRRLLGG